MATASTRIQLVVDDLLAAVKQLRPAELREFRRQFTAWSGQNGGASDAAEEALLTVIRENSRLPVGEQRRFNRLRRKLQAGTLTKSEDNQLKTLWRQAEQMNATRLEALGELARRRGTDLGTLVRELGLPENRDVF